MSFIEITGMSKRFGATQALAGVSLSLERGDVHGLLGENGAGKSTLTKILAGVQPPDEGSFRIDGEDVILGRPEHSRAVGLAMAYQELSAPPNITVAEKLLLPDLPANSLGMVSKKRLYAKAEVILAEWGRSEINPRAVISRLNFADKQYVEIIAALSRRPKLLILDEPTSSLPDPEWLFGCIERLVAEGSSVIYISHKLAEIARICTKGSVLRNGRVVKDFDPETVEESELVELMIGRSLDHVFPDKHAGPRAEPTVKVSGLTVGDKLSEVNLSIAPGEVVGISALEGQGQKELFYALAGLVKPDAGTVNVQSAKEERDFVLVPEDRTTEGLFLPLTTRANLTITELKKFSIAGVLSSRREKAISLAAAEEVNLPVANLKKEVGDLSGGNQQKVLFGRAILSGPHCLLLFDPTRGVDAATKVEIYSQIRKFTAAGGTALIYSTEIPELVGLSDRVYSLYQGHVTGEFSGTNLTENAIIRGALGTKEAGVAHG
jgi:ribose transport system ATP-binding protein